MQSKHENQVELEVIAIDQLTRVSGGADSNGVPQLPPDCGPGMYPDQTYIQAQVQTHTPFGTIDLGQHTFITNRCLPVPK
jgi:hypothetical protein